MHDVAAQHACDNVFLPYPPSQRVTIGTGPLLFLLQSSLPGRSLPRKGNFVSEGWRWHAHTHTALPWRSLAHGASTSRAPNHVGTLPAVSAVALYPCASTEVGYRVAYAISRSAQGVCGGAGEEAGTGSGRALRKLEGVAHGLFNASKRLGRPAWDTCICDNREARESGRGGGGAVKQHSLP